MQHPCQCLRQENVSLGMRPISFHFAPMHIDVKRTYQGRVIHYPHTVWREIHTLAFLLSSSFNPVTICRAPVQRKHTVDRSALKSPKTEGSLSKGCPKAIAPPLTLTFSGSMPSFLMQYTHWDANASLICPNMRLAKLNNQNKPQTNPHHLA